MYEKCWKISNTTQSGNDTNRWGKIQEEKINTMMKMCKKILSTRRLYTGRKICLCYLQENLDIVYQRNYKIAFMVGRCYCNVWDSFSRYYDYAKSTATETKAL